MSDSVRWDPTYSVGVGAFDVEHRRLLDLANAVIEASSQAQAREAVPRLLEALNEESQRHFASEEAMMLQAGYPLLADHRDKHARLIAELHMFIRQYEVEHLGPKRLARFLIDWLVHHIVVEDKKFQHHREGMEVGRGADAPRSAGQRPG